MHRAPVLPQEHAIGEDIAEGGPALHNGTHGQKGVEPVPELEQEGLADEVGGEPFLPVLAVVTVAQCGKGHDARIQPGVAHIGDARDQGPALLAPDLHRVHPGAMGGMPLKLLPALNGPLPQFLLAANDVEPATLLALPDRQGQPPVALLGDHPVMHVAQPVHLPLEAEGRNPAGVLQDLHDLVAKVSLLLLLGHFLIGLVQLLAHGDEPLIHQPEYQLRPTAPADGVAVGVVLHLIQQPLALQLLEDGVCDLRHVATCEPAEPLDVYAELIQWREYRQVIFLTEGEVLRAAAGGDVDDARALRLAHLIPQDHSMGIGASLLLGSGKHCLHGGQVIEGAIVSPALQRTPRHLLQDLVVTVQHVQRPLGEVEDFVPLAHFDVGQVGADSRSDVGGEGPGCGGPHQQGLPLPTPEGKAQGDARMGQLLIAFGYDLMLADPRAAAGAPGHHIAALVDPALLVALLEGGPDAVVVLIGEGEIGAPQFGGAQSCNDLLHRARHRALGPLDRDHLLRVLLHLVPQPAKEIGVVPVHPVSQPLGLFILYGGVLEHPLFAEVNEGADAIGLDVPFGFEAQLPLHLHLDP